MSKAFPHANEVMHPVEEFAIGGRTVAEAEREIHQRGVKSLNAMRDKLQKRHDEFVPTSRE